MQVHTSSGGDRADIVSLADRLAARYHEGQPDKAGEPYIGHPRRVAARLSDPTLKAAALLHDVLEDTEATPASLAAEGVPLEVIRIVEILTRREGKESYEAFVARVAKDPCARIVKIADSEHAFSTSFTPLPSHTRGRETKGARSGPRSFALKVPWFTGSPCAFIVS
ncbi:MAG: HD domain-containing protein [Gaiellaceae bacterium]